MKKMFRFMTPSVFLIAASLSLSCTIWNAQQWERFNNPSFHFQKFTYHLKGTDRRTAFEFIRDFPIDDLLRIIAEKYSIAIDAAEFKAFMDTPDNERRLKVFGVLLSERFSWESAFNHANTIEFEYANEFEDESTNTRRRYSLVLKTDGKVRAVYGDVVEGREHVAGNLSNQVRRR
jgi:hypothetical protein